MNKPKLEITRAAMRWVWKLVEADGAVLAISGRSFATKQDALRGINDTMLAIKATREVYAETCDAD
jgi:hypothetical protein